MTPYVQMLTRYVRPECQAVFAYEYERNAKDPTLALALTVMLGIVGGESYYLGNWRRGVLMSLALFTGIGLFITIPLWIIRCFTITGECDAYNDELAYALAWRYYDPADASPEPPQPPQPEARRRAPIGGLPMRVTPTNGR
jgi:hypothetical protein